MNSKQINNFFKNLKKNIKNPKTALKYKNKFTLLVSVVLSAQCTDKNVNNVTKDIYNKYFTPKHFLNLGEKKIQKLIRRIGLFRNKSKSIYNLSKELIKKYEDEIKEFQNLNEKHRSKIPGKFNDLIKLPGVGRKTANVILNELFNIPTIAVDTHIFRVSNRTKLAPGKTPDHVEQELYNVAESHALVTMKNLVRKDSAIYHVGSFDETTGDFFAGDIHLGFNITRTF